MKSKVLIILCLCLVTLCAFSLSYDPESWTKCITNGYGVDGNKIKNDYFCNTFDGEYDGDQTVLSQCELYGIGDGIRCSGNSLGFYPAMK